MNDLTAVIPQILAQTLLFLRGTNVMATVINKTYSEDAKKKGATIDIPLPSVAAVRDVTPGPVAPGAPGLTPESVQLTLNKWKEVPFYMTDKEIKEAMDGFLPSTARTAASNLIEYVNTDILSTVYKDVYNVVGTPGTTPFASSPSAITAARRELEVEKVPKADRTFVFDPDTEMNALNLPVFQQVNTSGIIATQQEGEISRKFGFNWGMDQSVATHTAGTITNNLSVNGAQTASNNISTVPVDTAGGDACALVHGDKIQFSGHSQTYAVYEDLTLGNSDSGNLKIVPQLQADVADNETISVASSYVANLAFHLEAFAFASRPLLDNDVQGIANVSSMVDPLTGLALRLEVDRQHRQTEWAFDILYGIKTVRPEMACIVYG